MHILKARLDGLEGIVKDSLVVAAREELSRYEAWIARLASVNALKLVESDEETKPGEDDDWRGTGNDEVNLHHCVRSGHPG